MSKQFSKHLTIILQEMCKRVNAVFNEVDFLKDDWYWSHSWTEKEQEDFRDWLINYLYTNAEARKEILESSWKNKKHCRKSADMFIFCYGWILEEDKNEKTNAD